MCADTRVRCLYGRQTDFLLRILLPESRPRKKILWGYESMIRSRGPARRSPGRRTPISSPTTQRSRSTPNGQTGDRHPSVAVGTDLRGRHGFIVLGEGWCECVRSHKAAQKRLCGFFCPGKSLKCVIDFLIGNCTLWESISFGFSQVTSIFHH